MSRRAFETADGTITVAALSTAEFAKTPAMLIAQT